MRKYLRFSALLLTLCILAASLSSCMTYLRLLHLINHERVENTSETEDVSNDVSKLPIQPACLVYSLDDNDRKQFDSYLKTCREKIMEGTDEEGIDAAWETFEAQFYRIRTQSQIAYILYCMDLSDAALSDDYLYAAKMEGECYDAYMELCREIDESNSPYRDTFFSDWTEDDLAAMRGYSRDVSDLNAENDHLLVEFRSLSTDEVYQRAPELYLEFVHNADQIAELMGYDDYYTYYSKQSYARDYGTDELEQMRAYVSEILLPLCVTLGQRFAEGYDRLGYFSQQKVYSFLYEDYDALSEEYLTGYLSALPSRVKDSMQEVLSPEHAVYADDKDALNGAFTGWLYENGEAVCYFGPGYQSINTVVHEMGHYYAAETMETVHIPYDLAEVHSQGNEMLFLASLQEQLKPQVYEVLTDYLIYNALVSVIMCTVIDDFEMRVYRNVDAIQTTEDLDRIMDSVLEQYGGAQYFNQYIGDAYSYWRTVTLQSPVYYISYAVSGIVSTELYALAAEDFDRAVEAYRSLVEGYSKEKGFLQSVSEAGFGSPFDVQTYQHIVQIVLEGEGK